MPGVDSNGFDRKTLEEILEEIETEQRDEIDPALNVSASSPIGQINGIFSSKLSEAWEILEVAYNAFNRSAAEGVALDNLGELTGTLRDDAQPTRVLDVNVNIDDGFDEAPGTMVASIAGRPDLRFVNEDQVTNSTGSTDDFLINFVAEETGPTVVNDQTLTVIAEPLTGWNSVSNNQSPDPDNSTTVVGNDVETDTDYRASQTEELRAQGGASEPAIDAALEAIEGVISVTVFFNDTDFIDADGLPPHSIEALVYDGETPAADNLVIAQTLFDKKAAGIQAVGTEGPFDAVTSEGTTYPIRFSRPTIREIYVEVDYVVDGTEPANVDDLIKDAVVAEGTAKATPGRIVYALDLKCAALEVAGVIDVPELRLGFSASPVGTTNLILQTRELATFSTARITNTDVT